MKTIIDTHAHIDQCEDVAGALQRAAEVNVSDIVAVGMNLQSNKDLLKIQKDSLVSSNCFVQDDSHSERAKRVEESLYPCIHVGLGLHPSDVLQEDVEAVVSFIRTNIDKAICVGEVGLDYRYKDFYENPEAQLIQRLAFGRMLDIAKEFDKPIVIHSRNAEEDCLQMTKDAGIKKALFHWYSGPVDIMEKILAQGYYVSTSPAVGFSGFSRKAMKYAPVERILIETDTPVYYRDKNKENSFRAEPKDVWKTLEALAEWKQIDRDKLLDIVNGNARTFFGI